VQGYASMNAATKTLEELIIGGKLATQGIQCFGG
jgi:hypothetical protein